MSKKQPTKEEIRLEVAKSKSDNLRQKVEKVYNIKDDAQRLKKDVIINGVCAGLMGIGTILAACNVFNFDSTIEKAFTIAWWLGFTLEDAYSAYKKNIRRNDMETDIALLEEDIFTEERLTLG